jgi:hypothetical protein
LTLADHDDLAEAGRRRQRNRRILLWLTRCTIGVGPGTRSARRAVRALEAERESIGAQLGTSQATYGETVVRSIAKRSADGVLEQTDRKVSRLARRTDRLKARRNVLRDLIALVPDEHVRHVDGGRRTVEEAKCDREALQARVTEHRHRGSRMHDRTPGWIRRLPRIVLVLDFFLLLYFFSGITDVDWSAPLSEPLAFAAGLAAMITAASYGGLAFAGHCLRRHKDHTRAISVADLDWLTRLVTVAAALGVVILALLMFVRMRSEVLFALGPGSGATAIVIASALAMVSVLANILVIAVHALDGSEETDRLDALGASIGDAQARIDKMRRKVKRLERRIAARRRRAQHVAARGRSRAGRPMANADQIIDNARLLHQGAGPFSELATDPNLRPGVIGYREPDATPQADERPLRLSLGHMESD